MTTPSPHSASLVTCTHDDAGTAPNPLSSGDFADKNASPNALELWQIAATFPGRWKRFLKVVYDANVGLIMLEFSVCERTARRWLAGKGGGVRAVHTDFAQSRHPEAYLEIMQRAA